MICEKCNSVNPEGNQYCGRCGNALIVQDTPRSSLSISVGLALIAINVAALLYTAMVYVLTAFSLVQNYPYEPSWILDLYGHMFIWHLDILGFNLAVVGIVVVLRPGASGDRGARPPPALCSAAASPA